MTDNTKKLAVALKYDATTDTAPVIAATGEGWLAEQIIALAKQHNIPVRSNAPLAELLRGLEAESPIPIQAYLAVANILSHIYAMDRKATN